MHGLQTSVPVPTGMLHGRYRHISFSYGHEQPRCLQGLFAALVPVGVQCELDAWSEYTAAVSPAARQDASLVWDTETQSALMFGGHASSAFLYFADLWRYDWPQRAWFQILSEDSRQGGMPKSRSKT